MTSPHPAHTLDVLARFASFRRYGEPLEVRADADQHTLEVAVSDPRVVAQWATIMGLGEPKRDRNIELGQTLVMASGIWDLTGWHVTVTHVELIGPRPTGAGA